MQTRPLWFVLAAACHSETGVTSGTGEPGTPTDGEVPDTDTVDTDTGVPDTVDSTAVLPTGDTGPVEVRSFRHVAVGQDHVCAADPDGLVWCWGQNYVGQLGDPAASELLVPTPVTGIDDVTALALGHGFSCALRGDRTVWCWGRGEMLGNALGTSVPTPTALPDLTDVVAIDASRINACALQADGDLWCWGQNDNAQSSDPGFEAVPVQVTGIGPVAEIAVGAGHRCLRLTTGEVRCWGYGQGGRLGTGDEASQTVPTPVVGLDASASVSTVSAGLFGSCAALQGGVQCWGAGEIAGTPTNSFVPAAPLPGVGELTGLSMENAACGLEADGTPLCWGLNSAGQLGTGDTGPVAAPVTPTGLLQVTTIQTGGSATCAIADGAVWCWGTNSDGAVGDGTTDPRLVPVLVLAP